jgi:hypothetical protein
MPGFETLTTILMLALAGGMRKSGIAWRSGRSPVSRNVEGWRWFLSDSSPLEGARP